MTTPNYPQQGPYGNQPPQGGPGGGGYGPPPGGQPGQPGQPYGQPYGGQPQTPPGGQPYGGPQTPPGGQPPQTPPGGQPYGGQPQQGQPFGAQPPGGQPPAAYPTPPPPDPAAKPGKGGTIAKIIGGIVVLGILVGGFLYFQGKSASSAAVGDCIKVNNASATNADVEKIDCNSAEAMYKVGVTKDDSAASCPSDTYVSYTEEGSLLLCLQLNVKEGECIHETTTDDKRVDCGSPDASYKVAKVIKGKDDANECGAENAENALTYPEPALTICRVAADAA